MNSKIRNVIIIVVTGVWVTNFVLVATVDTYNPSEAINAIFMGIVGGALAYGAKEKPENKDKH